MPLATPAIRVLETTDLTGAFDLSSAAGWNQRLEDWRMLVRLAPAGSFCALINGRLVGTAIGIDYGGFGWIAMMLVDPQYRGQGLGARLLEAAMGTLPPELPIRLDATPLGRPLYQRYGFEDETMLTRHVAKRNGPPAIREGPVRVRAITTDDLLAIVDVDRRVFCGNRHRVLQWALEGEPRYAHVVDGTSGPQYCFGRRGRLFDQIGPVVAEDEESARALLAASLGAVEDRAAVVDAFDVHDGFTPWLGTRGFTPQRPLFRMRRGASAASADPERNRPLEFAIFGPEFA